MANPVLKPAEFKIEDPDLLAIHNTIMDLTYNGFNAADVRAELSTKLEVSEIVTLVSAYCQIGNKPVKSMGKVKKQRNDIIPLVNKSGTTLARIGLAYPALVRAIRDQYKRNLGPRVVNCKTPSDYQDPATAPYHETGRDFYELFGRLIFNPLKAKSGVDYFMIAQANLDPKSKELMGRNLDIVVKEIKAKRY
jgi:hypothetical protein